MHLKTCLIWVTAPSWLKFGRTNYEYYFFQPLFESWIMKYKKVHQLMPLCYWLRTSNLTTFYLNPFWFLMKLSKIWTCLSHFSPIFHFCTPRNGTLDWNLLSRYAFLVISLEIKIDTDNVVTFSKTGTKKYSKRQGKKQTPTKVVSSDYCEIFKNTYFEEQLFRQQLLLLY